MNTRDVEQAKRFYADTLGWTFEAMPMPQGDYWVANAAGKPVGGIFDINAFGLPPDVPEHWLSYLAVDDVDARVRKAKAAGATMMMLAILKEPGGAVIGWITPVATDR